MNRYRYEVFEGEVDSFVEDLGCPATIRAWKIVKMAVLGLAWVDFDAWADEVDTERALSLAWEDMVVSFVGYGSPAQTGAIISLWMALDKDMWDGFRETLTEGVRKSDEATPQTVPRRYFQSYRAQPPRTPDEGFNLPNIIPVTGRRTRNWAERNGHNPDSVEAQMAQIEEMERMGLVAVGGPGDKEIHRVTPKTPPTLRLIEGDQA